MMNRHRAHWRHPGTPSAIILPFFPSSRGASLSASIRRKACPVRQPLKMKLLRAITNSGQDLLKTRHKTPVERAGRIKVHGAQVCPQLSPARLSADEFFLANAVIRAGQGKAEEKEEGKSNPMASQWVRDAESSANPRPSLGSTLDLTSFIPAPCVIQLRNVNWNEQRSEGPWDPGGSGQTSGMAFVVLERISSSAGAGFWR